LTADTEGQVEPCRDCPGQPSLGGIARRATLLVQLRQAYPSLLLVDAGNALFGAESLESQGRVIVAAYQALGYDAINLSYRDFRRGKAATLALLQDASFAVLSANLLDADTGHPLVQPYVIKQVAHERIALIGITQFPAGLTYLRHLKEQLTGIRSHSPLEALSQWLPKAQAESDRVILLYYGTPAGLHPIRERFGNTFAAILVSGRRPEDLPADVEPPVIGTSARGRHVAHLRLPSLGGGAKGEVTQVAVEPTAAPDDTVATLMNQVKGVSDASGALPGHGRPELAQPSERSTASEAAAQQIQGRKGRRQRGQKKARPQTPPSLPESRVQTSEQERTESTAEPGAPQPQEEQLPKPHPGMEIVLPGGKVEAILARDVTALSEPKFPTSEFTEDAQEIYLVLKSELAKPVSVHARWIAANVEGMQADHRLSSSRLRLNPSQRDAIRVKAPRRGFSLGDYRVEIAVNNRPAQSLSFTVVPILRDLPKNLASPASGGAIVRFTSQHSRHGGVHQMIDGRTDTPAWRSADSYLPQEFVFAFRGDQVALIDQIILNPKTNHDPTTGPKRITVSVSAESPLDGFQEVGQFTLLQEPRDQKFPIGRRARFVRLRILENFGGKYTSLGEVQFIEGSAVDYESILLKRSESTLVPRDTRLLGPMNEAEVAMEHEPNGTLAQANPLELGQTTKGVIDPLGEEDYFTLAIPGHAPSVLTLELFGRPNIRTSLTLFDAAGKSHKRFDPGAVPMERATFSWAVAPGDHVMQVTRTAHLYGAHLGHQRQHEGQYRGPPTGGGDVPLPGAP
jgi:Sad1 / UNC-like C-terminal